MSSEPAHPCLAMTHWVNSPPPPFLTCKVQAMNEISSSRSNLEKGKWGNAALRLPILLGFQINHLKNGFYQIKQTKSFISNPCFVFTTRIERTSEFSANFLKKKKKKLSLFFFFLPCILHKHERHSGTRKLYLHRLGIQLPWGSWKALHEAYCTAESFLNNKVGMQAPLWLHLCTEKCEQVIIAWKTTTKALWQVTIVYLTAICLLFMCRSITKHEKKHRKK